ncbi:MAG: hypothetical protein VXW27_09835, partial [Pseudomonadota bacterium]|nr:hypothetical protein [Pseudomonadota bacterium]
VGPFQFQTRARIDLIVTMRLTSPDMPVPPDYSIWYTSFCVVETRRARPTAPAAPHDPGRMIGGGW